jgi:hypothetical protein
MLNEPASETGTVANQHAPGTSPLHKFLFMCLMEDIQKCLKMPKISNPTSSAFPQQSMPMEDMPSVSDQLFSAAFHHDVAFSQRLKVEARVIGSSWEQRITKDLLRQFHTFSSHRHCLSPTHSKTIRVADSLVF